MAARPKTRLTKKIATRSAARKTTAKKSAARKIAAKRRSAGTASARARLAAANAMRAAFDGIVVPDRPQPIPIPCSTSPVTTSGTAEYENAYTRAAPDMVILILNGFTLGIVVPVTWTKTVGGWTFEGWRPGCYVEKCSTGAASTEKVWVDGTIDTTQPAARLTFHYEYHALCGEQVTCIETGTYIGDRIDSGADPRDADWRGATTWQHDCCPDRTWKFSVGPPPPAPGVHGRTEPKRKR